ncbi:MAG TPA: hypothetical protein VF189_01800 [Patescibacteria group bacterium]
MTEFFPGDTKTKTLNFIFGRPKIPEISAEDARNTRDRSKFREFEERIGIYNQIHKIHFLKDALISIGLFSLVNSQTENPLISGAAVVIPLLGIIAHTLRWGNGESKVREAQGEYERALEEEKVIEKKIGSNRIYQPSNPKDRDRQN